MADAKMVWVLFGNMSNLDDLRSKVATAYLRHKQKLDEKGYYLGIPPMPGTSKHGFLNYIADDTTHAVVWNSHGNLGGRFPDGALVAADNQAITPTDVARVSKNLRAVALWGCLMGRVQGWRESFRLQKAPRTAFLASNNFHFDSLPNANPMYTFPITGGEASFDWWIENLL
jgi:hypothetical protein